MRVDPYSGCFLCANKRLNVCIYCENYKELKIKPLDENIKKTLFSIFSKKGKYYLPNELIEKIISYSYTEYIDHYIRKDIMDVDYEHVRKCRLCSEMILSYFKSYVCCYKIPPELKFVYFGDDIGYGFRIECTSLN